MAKRTILFLAANPTGTDPRALDREARSIRVELKHSGHRDRFEFETRWAAEPLDLLRELRELEPTVVHFSGHGGQRGLFFQAPDGRAQLVSTEALAETFGAAGASVKLVVLSACYSEAQAEALLAHVDCVVGMGGAIHDDAARSFAIGFYGGLGANESVAAACRQGRAAISLAGLPDRDRPQLKVRAGVDAEQLVPSAAAPELVDLPCPYPGMRPYSADDAAHFHGRGAELDELLDRLRAGEREIYVIGPSGSGKSSLVAAGLLPRLARGVRGLGPFIVRSMRPGEQPTARLGEVLEVPPEELAAPAPAIAALLAHRAPGASVLIVVDQLEELFALASADERAGLLRALRSLRAEPRCVVVLTLRADFFGSFMECPLWPDRRGRLSRVEVSPLRGRALRAAIVQPARDLGVLVEPELTERLLADAASEPGILPLLQETLVQLWERRQGRSLSLADYETLGDRDRSGLAVALARRADATLRALTPAQEAIARRILLRLISFGEGRSDTRRQQARSKLRAADDDAADFEVVLRRLVADRLLTTDDDDDLGDARVDLAHEVMITAWPTLAGWVQTRRADEQRRRQLEAAAAQWVERGRGARGLLDPDDLTDAEAWRRTETARELGESADVAALVTASRTAHDRQRRRLRGLAWSALATLAVLVMVAALAVVARWQAQAAEASRQESLHRLALSYQEEGRQLLLEGLSLRALPYLVAARRQGEIGAPLRMLFWTATRSLPVVLRLDHRGSVTSARFSPDGTRVLTTASTDIGKARDLHILDLLPGGGPPAPIAHYVPTTRIWDAITGKPLAHLEYKGTVSAAAFSPDGKHVVTANDNRTARVWDAGTGEPISGPLKHEQTVQSVAFGPDGKRVVTASDDQTARIWDVATGQMLTTPLAHQGIVLSASFSPDGSRVVTASHDQTARIWDAATGKLLTIPLAHRSIVRGATFSPDGTRILTASADRMAQIWNATTGEPLATLEHQGSVGNATFSPDGKLVLTVSDDRSARVWVAATGKLLTTLRQHQEIVWSAAFSADGTRIVTASYDRIARVWEAATGKLLDTLEHQDIVRSATFSPDGTRVITASADRTAQIWDATTSQPLAHQHTVWSAAFSPDGTRVVTASADRTARIWEVATSKPLTRPLEHQAAVWSASFSPDGSRVVTRCDRTVQIWDAATGTPLGTPLHHQEFVWSVAFSPDGKRIVTASADGTARIWDALTGQQLAIPLHHDGVVSSAAFSPDGKHVVTASDDRTARIWNAATAVLLTATLPHQGAVRSAAFSPDGKRVVTASDDRTAAIWDAGTGKQLAKPLQHAGAVRSASFSPDGAYVVTASADNTAQVWDAATSDPLATPLEHRGPVRSAAFSPDGARVVTASDDHTAVVWDAETGKPLTMPLEHRGAVERAVFSPDGSHVVTASEDHTARVWPTRLDERALDEWSALAERSPFVLRNGVLTRRTYRTRGLAGN